MFVFVSVVIFGFWCICCLFSVGYLLIECDFGALFVL